MIELILAVIVFAGSPAMAQDVLLLKNGEEIKAIVKEVGSAEVKYVRHDNANGPIYSIKKTEVFMIKYQNGTKDVFKNEAPQASVPLRNDQPKQKGDDSSVRKARTASTMGYLLAIPIMGLGAAAASAEDFDEGIPLGASATLIGAVGIPLVAGAARRVRSETGVDGSPGLRVAGWVAYGLALGDAIALLALSSSEVDTGSATWPVAILGSASSIFMAIDAGQTASQAKTQLAQLPRVQPFLGSQRDHSGKSFQTLGIRIRL